MSDIDDNNIGTCHTCEKEQCELQFKQNGWHCEECYAIQEQKVQERIKKTNDTKRELYYRQIEEQLMSTEEEEDMEAEESVGIGYNAQTLGLLKTMFETFQSKEEKIDALLALHVSNPEGCGVLLAHLADPELRKALFIKTAEKYLSACVE
jgi:hypothetical protein